MPSFSIKALDNLLLRGTYLRYYLGILVSLFIAVAIFHSVNVRTLQQYNDDLHTLDYQRIDLFRAVALIPVNGMTQLQHVSELSTSFREGLVALPEQVPNVLSKQAMNSLKLGGNEFGNLIDVVLAGGYTVLDLAYELEQLYLSDSRSEMQMLLDKIGAFFFLEIFAAQRSQPLIDQAAYRAFIEEIEMMISMASESDRAKLEQILVTLSPMVVRHSQYESTVRLAIEHHFNNQLPALTKDVELSIYKASAKQLYAWICALFVGVLSFVLLLRQQSLILTQTLTVESTETMASSESPTDDFGNHQVSHYTPQLSVQQQRSIDELLASNHVDLPQAPSNPVVPEQGEIADTVEGEAQTERSEQLTVRPDVNVKLDGHLGDEACSGSGIEVEEMASNCFVTSPNASNPNDAETDVASVVNLNELHAVFDGDEEAVHMLLTVFLEEHQDDYRRLTQLLNARQFEDAERLAHSIKGVSGSFGANNLHQASALLEKRLRSGQVSREELAQFEEQLHLVVEAIASYLKVEMVQNEI